MSKQNIRTLEDHFCFSVYATSHAIQRLYKTELVNHGLTYPQYLVLVVLYEQEGMSVNWKAVKFGYWDNNSTAQANGENGFSNQTEKP